MSRSIRTLSLLGSTVAMLCLVQPLSHAQTAPATTAPATTAPATTAPTPSTPAPAAAPSEAKLATQDVRFLKDAAASGMAEVEASQLALSQASNEDVKKFAQHMVDDHTKANEELKTLAGSKNVALPTALDAKHQALLEKLRAAKGEQFDHLYLQEAGVKAHKEAHGLFKKASKQAKDPEVKAFFTKTEPTIEAHLKEVRTLADASHGKKAKK